MRRVGQVFELTWLDLLSGWLMIAPKVKVSLHSGEGGYRSRLVNLEEGGYRVLSW